MKTLLSIPGAELRLHDHDRFVAALFAPSDRRESLFTLYAFASALGRRGRDTLAGHVRLQWWRDFVVLSMTKDCLAVAATCGNPIAESLTHVITQYRLDTADLLSLIEAHADSLDSMVIPNTEALLSHVTATTDPLTRLSLTILGGGTSLFCAPLGLTVSRIAVAAALVRCLQAVPQHIALGRILLPLDRLRAAGITPDSLLGGKPPRGLSKVAAEIASLATSLLPEKRDIVCPPPEFIPLFLPVITSTVHLSRLRHSGFDLFNPRHALARPPIVRLCLASLLGRYDWLQNRNGLIK